MKQLFNILFFSLLIFNKINAQTGWYQQLSGVSYSLRSVQLLDSNTGYIAGYFGTVLKTTNAGVNWFSLNIDSALNLDGLFFINTNTGYVAGGNGSIYKTVNGGVNWQYINTTITGYSLLKIFCLNIDTIFACGGSGSGGIIIKTTDGGSNWLLKQMDGTTPFQSMVMCDNSTGYCIGSYNGRIYKTTNGGDNWVYTSLSPLSELWDLSFLNSNLGYISDKGGEVLKTTNGGSNWQQQTTGYSFSPWSVYFTDINTGTIVCASGLIFRTTNGGINWIFNNTPVTTTLQRVYFINALTGFAVGDNGVILKTTDGGGMIGIKPISEIVPDKFYLYQNYPNPFNPSTNIKFDVTKFSNVKIKIYNSIGQELFTLINSYLQRGEYSVTWNPIDSPTGIYFYKLTTDSFSDIRKMILIK